MSVTVARRIRSHVGVAVRVGLVGGMLLGVREALVTVDANVIVQPGQYLGGYVALPVLGWMALAAVAMVPCGIVTGLLMHRTATAAIFPVHAAVLAAIGVTSILAPAVAGIGDKMAAVGFAAGAGVTVGLWSLAAVLVVASMLVVWAAAERMSSVADGILRGGTWLAIAALPVLSWPMVRFLMTDWRWAIAAPASTAAAPAGPNIVLISIDTLRADHLGAYGHDGGLTPRLDRLSAEGLVFETAITSAPWTLPAMASLFTGLHPHRHGAGEITNSRDPLGRSPLPSATWTVTEALRAAGYETRAIVTNPYLTLHYGLGGGFESYENVTVESELFIGARNSTAARLATWMWPALVVGDRGETVSRRAATWLETRARTRPFFLWLHYIDPHPPYSAAGVAENKSFRGDLVTEGRAEVSLSLSSPDIARLRSGEIRLDEHEREAVRRLYRTEVARVDRAVGEVLDALERAGMAQNTLVVCVADHGEEFWDHGGVEHGHTVYDELVHVPLLMRWPLGLAPRRVPGVVRIVDVAPTVLDLVGVAPPPALDGTTARPMLDGSESAPRTALVENMLFADERVGLRTARHKYVRWATGKLEVFDLADDPHEQVDLAGVGDHRDAAQAAFATLGPRPTRAVPGRALDPASRAALRALGYAE